MVETSANTPILLEGQSVWYILEGRVEVFAVQLRDGKISGPKDHFLSAGPHALLFGMNLTEYAMGQGFQAVGYPGTKAAHLSMNQLMALGQSPEYREDIIRAVDQWTAGLSRGMTKDIIPKPRPDLLLSAGPEESLERDRIACPESHGGWLEYLEGTGLYISTEDVLAGGSLLPLSPNSWLLAFKGSRIRLISTTDALVTGRLWSSLDAFYALIFQAMLMNSALKAVDIYNLMREKTAQGLKAKKQGLIRLASVMDKACAYHATHEFSDPLSAACSSVAEALGLDITMPPPPAEEAVTRKLTVQDIAASSGFNVRQVMLPDGWWRKDLGPLLGFSAKDHTPQALIPVSATRYETVEPGTQERSRVTAGTAAAIGPKAYTFYRPFPDTPLNGWDLVRFGLKGCGKDLKYVLVLASAIGLLGLIVPLTTAQIFNHIIPNADRAQIWGILAIITGFAVTTILFETCRNISLLRVENRLYYALDAALWDRLIRLSTPFFRQYETGDLTTRAMGMSMIRQLISGPVITVMISSFFSGFNLFLIFYYHQRLAWVGTGLIAAAGAVISCLCLWQLRYVRTRSVIEGKISSLVMQFLSAVTKLRVSGAEDNAFAIWARHFSRQKKLAFKAEVIQNITATFINNFLLLALMVLFSWMVFKEGATGLETGDYIAFNAAFAGLNAAMVQMIMALTGVVAAIPYYERIAPILQTCPETDRQKTDPGSLSGKIELCHIYFRYTPDTPMVLKDVSLDITPGSFVAIVGGSGSGKSTLIRLLLGFETPESGTIFYDDNDLNDLNLRQVRKNMGVVIQAGNIMAGDLFTNIIGSHPLTLEDAWEAARMVGLDEDIEKMPMGMHTMIMEGASTLSGGQRQRLMIARAIVNRPAILIFDEATSALDNRTQAVVSDSLSRLKSTRIIVAHRLSTIKDADKIYVMDKGEIRESGTFDSLMARDGLFKRLAERQLL